LGLYHFQIGNIDIKNNRIIAQIRQFLKTDNKKKIGQSHKPWKRIWQYVKKLNYYFLCFPLFLSWNMLCTMVGCRSLYYKKRKKKNAKVNQLGILILHTILAYGTYKCNMASSTFQCQVIILF
jgi:hypothetical protein